MGSKIQKQSFLLKSWSDGAKIVENSDRRGTVPMFVKHAQCVHSMCSLTTDVALKRQTNINQNLKTLWLQPCKYARPLTIDGCWSTKCSFKHPNCKEATGLDFFCVRFLQFLGADPPQQQKIKACGTFYILYIFTISQEVTPVPPAGKYGHISRQLGRGRIQ